MVLTRFDVDASYSLSAAADLVSKFEECLGRSVPFQWLASYLKDPASVMIGHGNWLGFDLAGNLFTLGDRAVDEPYLPLGPEEAYGDCLCLIEMIKRTSAS